MPKVEIRLCSSGVVSIVVTFDRMSVSRPVAVAATPTRTAAPSPRRIKTPVARRCLIAEKKRPPARSANASDRSANRIREEQERGSDVRALERHGGEDKAQDRTCAGCPEEASRDADDEGGREARSSHRAAEGAAQPFADRNRRPRQERGQPIG